jgi:hypothetical protein
VGQVYWPALGINQIGSMQPGQGYQINLSSAGTLTYPTSEPALVSDEGEPVATRTTSGVGGGVAALLAGAPSAVSATLGLENLEAAGIGAGEVIGVLDTAGHHVGSTVVEGVAAAVTLWGDDPSTAKECEGLRAGEPFQVVVRHASGATEVLELSWTQGRAAFEVNAILLARVMPRVKLPTALALDPPRPNPSRERTIFGFALAKEGEVRLSVYSVDGRRVRTLVDERRAPGLHSVTWDQRDQSGRRVAPGLYLCRLEQGGTQLARRLLVLR